MSGAKRVLVVEDEPKIARVVEEYLHAAGFETHVLGNGNDVQPWVRAHAPDLVLLDVMLPGMDGVSVLKALRQRSSVPVILLTARVEEEDRLEGLEAGADDYVCKPFSPRELVARVKAVLRRPAVAEGEKGTLHAGPFILDEARETILQDGAALELTASEYRLLRRLVRGAGRTYSRAQLLEELPGNPEESFERAIDTHVKNLRRKLGDRAGMIRSVYGAGYQLDL